MDHVGNVSVMISWERSGSSARFAVTGTTMHAKALTMTVNKTHLFASSVTILTNQCNLA